MLSYEFADSEYFPAKCQRWFIDATALLLILATWMKILWLIISIVCHACWRKTMRSSRRGLKRRMKTYGDRGVSGEDIPKYTYIDVTIINQRKHYFEISAWYLPGLDNAARIGESYNITMYTYRSLHTYVCGYSYREPFPTRSGQVWR